MTQEGQQIALNTPHSPIDILVPVHGKPELTVKCVKSIYSYTRVPFHLIVMDDTEASIRDGAFHQVDPAEVTRPYFDQFAKDHDNITYINSPTVWKEGNEFFNKGFALCKYDYVATVMNSMTVEPSWETVALQLMDNDPQIGVIGFKCLFPNGLIESAGIVFNNFTPCDFARDEPGYRHPEISELQSVQWAFALLRKKAVVGNLPEGLFYGHVGWDDIDNCFAVKAKGWKIIYCGMGVGIHQPRATRGTDRIEASLMNKHNSHQFYKRWGYWQKYQEANKMDVSLKLKPELKDTLTMAVTEYQVLSKLLEERKKMLGELCNQAMKDLGVDPTKYVMDINPQTGIWDVRAIPESTPEVKPVLPPDNGHRETELITEAMVADGKSG